MLNPTKIGRYEVISALGQGAMGTVYKAVDPLIERTVAIKTINLNLSKEELAEFEERFYREAKSAGRLNHANIVTIYDVGETGDIAYIAMEYLEGESLREKLDSGVVLPVEMIGKIVARIASALNYAHENHVVHRDVKPANIMITSNRDVKIMDFGIAQIPTGSHTQLGTVLGSPKYMAPEQVKGQATDGRTDIFALGVVLYEMLTGTTPFNGDNLSAIMYKVLNEEPAPPSTINPRVPPAYDRIISRALAKRPEDRYQTAREFARDLKNPDAALLQAAQRSAAGNKPSHAGQASKASAGQQYATELLPRKKTRGAVAAAPVAGRPGVKEKIASALEGMQLSRKALLFAVPAVAIVVFVVYSQAPKPKTDTVSVLVAPVPEETRVTVVQPAAEPATETAAPLAAPAAPAAAPASAKREPRISTAPAVAAPTQATVPQAMESQAMESQAIAAKAALSFAISPWGAVYVDGKMVGVSPPLATLQLESGRHTVEIRNQAFVPYRDTVNLEPGQSLKIRHKFR